MKQRKIKAWATASEVGGIAQAVTWVSNKHFMIFETKKEAEFCDYSKPIPIIITFPKKKKI